MTGRKVLFLCTGNSARSQMAEALLREIAGDEFEPASAGTEPKGVHPLTVRVLKEDGIDISSARSKNVREFMGHEVFLDLITVCDHADSNCPTVFPGVQRRFHWSFKDPAAAEGTEEDKLKVFREVRDQIKARIKAWLDNPALGRKA
ncbi:MAG: arsenate reductase ArsC [Planctomycetes bacterium]|nr:arsenate reductase ArsC [Planctomycetota bacterium]